MRSESGGESAKSEEWGPRDWCASGVGGESFDLALEPGADRPRRAARSAPEPGSTPAERPGRQIEDWPIEAVAVKGEQEGERPDWVVDAEEGAASAEPSVSSGRARSGAGRRGAASSGSTRRDSGERGFGERTGGARGGRSRASREPGQPRAAREPGRSRATAAAEQDPAARARDICLRLLTGTPRTRKQLSDALRKREIPDEVAEEVLSRFEEVGLIDDAAFAAAWVESRHAGRGLARRALAQELRTRGVAGALVEEAVAQLDPDEEAATARALVERKLRTTAGLERQARMRRLVGLLARRGYSEGLAFRVVREVLDAEGESAEELEDWSLGGD
ncbi:regulatory protein [Kitasatospora sp. GAS204A]|uniref:recombination regulator RecX n=1 Tax=unclassified Kitasatospora TaxID=2633591 RepID=UPI0024769F8E|nr:recombination regulator RecX [Kitasatospora sp. GAS204B]MDH6121744.1 regulatory protein [Kitasatospora sp. GAS204B]